jgi:hypothetical protein
VGKFSRNFELVRKHRDSSQFDTTVLWRIWIEIIKLCTFVAKEKELEGKKILLLLLSYWSLDLSTVHGFKWPTHTHKHTHIYRCEAIHESYIWEIVMFAFFTC